MNVCRINVKKVQESSWGETGRRAAEASSGRSPLLKECSPTFSLIKVLCTLLTPETYSLHSEQNLPVRFKFILMCLVFFFFFLFFPCLFDAYRCSASIKGVS